MSWFLKGLRSSVKTLPSQNLGSRGVPGLEPGRPISTRTSDPALLAVCPTHALSQQGAMTVVDYNACIHCFLCQRGIDPPLTWENSHSRAVLKSQALASAFSHSLHVRVLDAGDCGACLNEIHQLTSPVYSLHRFGITLTPTPREADVLIIVGPVTVGMQRALRETYQAMPFPKRVLAIGACALSGGVYASSFAVTAPVSHTIPVDVEVPGCPPSPLAILEGLRLIMGPSGNNAAREEG